MAEIGDLVIKVTADTRPALKALRKLRHKMEWAKNRIAWIALAAAVVAIGISIAGYL